jgi:hypothetical protein
VHQSLSHGKRRFTKTGSGHTQEKLGDRETFPQGDATNPKPAGGGGKTYTIPGGLAYAKPVFLSHLYINAIFSPRQARDKHRETALETKTVFLYIGTATRRRPRR